MNIEISLYIFTFSIAIFYTQDITVLPSGDIEENSEVTLSCSSRDPNVYWRKIGSLHKWQSKIYFKKIDRYQSGIYECVSTEGSKKYNLEVLYSPEVTFIGTQPPQGYDVILSLGLTQTLYCWGSGNPSPIYNWYRNNIRLPGADQNISVKATKGEDRVEYICEAKNVIKGEERIAKAWGTLTIFVTDPASLNIVAHPQNEIEEHDQLTLLCIYGDGDTFWRKLGSEIGWNSNKISFQEIEQEMAGIYECISLKTKETKQFTVNVLYAPKVEYIGTVPPEGSVVIAKQGSQKTLYCMGSGNPNPTFVWYRNDVVIPNSGQNLTLNISMDMSGHKFSCEASNRIKGIRRLAKVLEPITITVIK